MSDLEALSLVLHEITEAIVDELEDAVDAEDDTGDEAGGGAPSAD